MSGKVVCHDEYIKRWLDLIGYQPRSDFLFEVLREGQSGAVTYRIKISFIVLLGEES